MSISIRKINNVNVSLPPEIKKDTRPVKGGDMFPEVFGNIFIASSKKSGKTTVIYNILKKCIGKDTTVIFFVSTLFKDPTYLSMMKMLDANGINYIPHTSLKEDGVDHLAELVDALKHKCKEEYYQQGEEKQVKNKKCVLMENEEEDDKKEKKKSKYLAPDYLLIFDDLSEDLKSPSLTTLLKKNRHYGMKIIVPSQYWNDILLESRNQCDYVLIFKNIAKEKIAEIRKNVSMPLENEEFYKIYKFATSTPYSFLYYDKANDTYRKNFNIEIKL